MLLEKNKCTRIMKEVVSYFLDNGMNEFHMDFSSTAGVFKLAIWAETSQEPSGFQKLLSDLNTERQLEVDEYYNALLGSNCHNHGHDYTFLGKAIDRADGQFADGRLSLTIWRFEEH